jgi:apolipoprotein N-acyltransferase
MNRWRRVALVLLSVALHAAAFPPWDVSIAAWVALVPFLVALRGLAPRGGLMLGLLWGSAAIWAVAPWVPAALTFYYGQPWWFGLVFCAIGSMILWGTYYAIFAAVACWLRPRVSGVLRPLLLAAVWVSCELARARLMTGEPWMLLGYSQVSRLHFIQAADLGGVYLLSFAVFFVNACLAEAAESAPLRLAWRPLAAAAALVAGLEVYGSMRLAKPLAEEGAISVAVVQANVDLGWQWNERFYGRDLEAYERLSAAAARAERVDLFVWPESAVTFFLAHEPPYQKSIARLLDATGADLLLGAPHRDDADPAVPRYLNSAFYVRAGSGIDGRYDKAHLLPFAEYFPLRFIDFLRRRFERVRTFAAGSGDVLLDTRLGKAAVVICFEAIFPERVRRQMARGADVLFNLSNDVWLGPHAGPLQHASMVTLRAVENRTWVIRATTTGVSAIIDPHGRWRAHGAVGTTAVLRGRVAPQHVDTVYKRYGDVFAYACLLVAIASLGLCRRRPVPDERSA